MPVVELHEDYSMIHLDVSADEETGGEEGELPRSWIVVFNGWESPIVEAYLARTAELGMVRVARLWEALPSDPCCYVVRQTVEPFSNDSDNPSPHMWRVTSYYRKVLDPLTLDPIVEYDFVPSSDVIDVALRKRTVYWKNAQEWEDGPCSMTNSSGESFDPPAQEDYFDQILRIRVNKRRYDRAMARKFIDTINEDTFLDYEPQKVKLIKWVGRRVRFGLGHFYEHEMEFICRIAESDPFDVGWNLRRVDEGYRWAGSADSNKPGKPILDEEGNPVTTPVLLSHGVPTPNTTKPTFLDFQVKKTRPFAALGIVLGPDGEILIPSREE